MLITFKSKAASEFVMYKKHAQAALDLLEKNVERGIITPDELPHAIEILETAVAASESQAPPPGAGGDDARAQDENDDESERGPAAPVSFATRMFPLLEMLRAARRTHNHVMWGV